MLGPMIAPSLVAAAAHAHLHTRIDRVEPVAGFADNDDFSLRTQRGGYILKAGEAGTIAAEAWACARVRDELVPAPEVVAVDLDCNLLPRPFLIETMLSGGPAASGDNDVIVAAGAALRAVHGITLDGYGFLGASAALPTGPLHSWPRFIGSSAQLDALSSAGELPVRLASRLRTVLAAGLPRCSTAPGVLLHGDPDPRHLFGAHGQLTGIIDWGDVAVGDPVFDLARFTRAEPAAIEALLRGYEADVTPELRWLIGFYRVVWTLIDLAIDVGSGRPDIVATGVAVIYSALDELGY